MDRFNILNIVCYCATIKWTVPIELVDCRHCHSSFQYILYMGKLLKSSSMATKWPSKSKWKEKYVKRRCVSVLNNK